MAKRKDDEAQEPNSENAESTPTEGQPDAGNAERVTAKRGRLFATYMGGADVVSVGDMTFRPGQPVEIPKALAEELLTFPNEDFAITDEVAVEADQVEE